MTRKVVTRSPRRKVGLVNCSWFQSDPVEHESQLEKRFVQSSFLCPGVIGIKSQPFTMILDGRKYTPDFQLLLENGQKIVVEVKIDSKVNQYFSKFNAAAAELQLQGIPFFVVTEKEIDNDENGEIAAEILRYGRAQISDIEIASIQKVFQAQQVVELPIDELISRSGSTRQTILNLIARRKLTLHPKDYPSETKARIRLEMEKEITSEMFCKHFNLRPWIHREVKLEQPEKKQKGLQIKQMRKEVSQLKSQSVRPNKTTPNALIAIAGGLPNNRKRSGRPDVLAYRSIQQANTLSK